MLTNEFNYFIKENILFVIHRLTGKWCSIDINDIENFSVDSKFGILSSLASKNGNELVDLIVQTLDVKNIKQSNTRNTLEYLLLKCTSACNYSCSYCYDHDEISTAKNLKFEEVKARIVEAIDLAGDFFTLLFHGGEPLLLKKFLFQTTIFAHEYAKKQGKTIFFKIQTHGGAFTDEIVDFLIKYDFFVGISIDGPMEINDRFRVLKDGQGTYKNFQQAYNKYNDFMLNNCGIITTPTFVSAQHLLLVARHFKSMGFKAWRTTNYLAIGRVQDDWDFESDTKTYADSIIAILDAIESGEFNGFYIGSVMSLLTNLLSDERPDMCNPGNNSCGAGRRFLSIEADGAILPCDTLSREKYTVGHISTTSLKMALQHKNSIVISESLPRASCQTCSLLGVCGGTCLGLSSLDENRPMLCNAYKQLYPELMVRLQKSERLIQYFDSCHEQEDSKLSNLLNMSEL